MQLKHFVQSSLALSALTVQAAPFAVVSNGTTISDLTQVARAAARDGIGMAVGIFDAADWCLAKSCSVRMNATITAIANTTVAAAAGVLTPDCGISCQLQLKCNISATAAMEALRTAYHQFEAAGLEGDRPRLLTDMYYLTNKTRCSPDSPNLATSFPAQAPSKHDGGSKIIPFPVFTENLPQWTVTEEIAETEAPLDWTYVLDHPEEFPELQDYIRQVLQEMLDNERFQDWLDSQPEADPPPEPIEDIENHVTEDDDFFDDRGASDSAHSSDPNPSLHDSDQSGDPEPSEDEYYGNEDADVPYQPENSPPQDPPYPQNPNLDPTDEGDVYEESDEDLYGDDGYQPGQRRPNPSRGGNGPTSEESEHRYGSEDSELIYEPETPPENPPFQPEQPPPETPPYPHRQPLSEIPEDEDYPIQHTRPDSSTDGSEELNDEAHDDLFDSEDSDPVYEPEDPARPPQEQGEAPEPVPQEDVPEGTSGDSSEGYDETDESVADDTLTDEPSGPVDSPVDPIPDVPVDPIEGAAETLGTLTNEAGETLVPAVGEAAAAEILEKAGQTFTASKFLPFHLLDEGGNVVGKVWRDIRSLKNAGKQVIKQGSRFVPAPEQLYPPHVPDPKYHGSVPAPAPHHPPPHVPIPKVPVPKSPIPLVPAPFPGPPPFPVPVPNPGPPSISDLPDVPDFWPSGDDDDDDDDEEEEDEDEEDEEDTDDHSDGEHHKPHHTKTHHSKTHHSKTHHTKTHHTKTHHSTSTTHSTSHSTTHSTTSHTTSTSTSSTWAPTATGMAALAKVPSECLGGYSLSQLKESDQKKCEDTIKHFSHVEASAWVGTISSAECQPHIRENHDLHLDVGCLPLVASLSGDLKKVWEMGMLPSQCAADKDERKHMPMDSQRKKWCKSIEHQLEDFSHKHVEGVKKGDPLPLPVPEDEDESSLSCFSPLSSLQSMKDKDRKHCDKEIKKLNRMTLNSWATQLLPQQCMLDPDREWVDKHVKKECETADEKKAWFQGTLPLECLSNSDENSMHLDKKAKKQCGKVSERLEKIAKLDDTKAGC
ncbi:uncharacterized protein LTR77_006239 [Saxophila tyrrhenica]|uniref:Uncharacterized protein n=1 Tax=Saxophila tyrrhenica TaxID=1690608 RepID=A0AAV9P806_9PEZI|nr:hypothetical protein LTR77_006239 [Saxophila tyrrhenica]